MPPLLRAPLDAFAADLTANFAAAQAVAAQAEDQLKGPTVTLIQAAGAALAIPDVVARTEALASDLGVRPDLGVMAQGLLTGHVELKAPGKGARPATFASEHDKAQFKRLSGHPNLIYTDGNEWALYREGKRTGPLVRADGDVRTDGATAFTDAQVVQLEALLRDFLLWQPIVPSTPAALARTLAPLARLLREAVRDALSRNGSAIARLAREWRDFFFPDADDAQFADAYAQTLTYALLLARVEGAADIHQAAERLDARHALLAQVLRVLEQPAARAEVAVPVSLLERSIAAVDPGELMKKAGDRDLWLYFYEDFLAAYDPVLRRQRGVYFTPPEVVRFQVRIVAELLRDRFGFETGVASENVVLLDPAVGTGTYLLAALEHGGNTIADLFGEGSVAGRATTMARNFHGFELGVGPYAVAHLRFAQALRELEGELPPEGPPIYLTDTLASPFAAPPGKAYTPLFQEKLAAEEQRARMVKAETPVLVCIGNPPYFRQTIDLDDEGSKRQGGWVRYEKDGSGGILRDFLRDAPPIHAKNLYNLYVYFWRWALWKVCEQGEQRGIVSFITASSYLRGPGFAGMRRLMRELFDELWIVDLGGDNRGTRPEENVFAIQTPVAIAIGVRGDGSSGASPARVRYSRVEGNRAEKLATLDAADGLAALEWRDCYDDWLQPFVPVGVGDYFAWPLLTDLFPWQHSGVQFKRTWPIAPTRETLGRRWAALVSSSTDRAVLFRETRDRSISETYKALQSNDPSPPLGELPAEAPLPSLTRYAYRSLDRQYCLADSRIGDFLRPALWHVYGPRQMFMTSLLTTSIGEGPAAMVTATPPDMHHFRGSFGAKDVIPLWRTVEADSPNIVAGLLQGHGYVATPEDVFAYVYALLSAPSYTDRFRDELEIPGPRVPVTRNAELFALAAELGRRLIFLHTFGERFVPEGTRAGALPPGSAKATKPVPQTPEGYPKRHAYDAEARELHVGDGVFAPVDPEVRAFSVSGLDVIGSWLDYRMKDGAGRRSSPLDEIRPAVWPAEFTEELVRLLWILEHTVALGPELDETLDAIVAGPVFSADELPQPTDAERLPPM